MVSFWSYHWKSHPRVDRWPIFYHFFDIVYHVFSDLQSYLFKKSPNLHSSSLKREHLWKFHTTSYNISASGMIKSILAWAWRASRPQGRSQQGGHRHHRTGRSEVIYHTPCEFTVAIDHFIVSIYQQKSPGAIPKSEIDHFIVRLVRGRCNLPRYIFGHAVSLNKPFIWPSL